MTGEEVPLLLRHSRGGGSLAPVKTWIPAYAGMTGQASSGRHSREGGSLAPVKTWIPASAGMTDEQFTVEKLIQRITQYASCRPVRIDPVSDQTPVVGDELVVFMGRELFTHNALQDAVELWRLHELPHRLVQM